MSRQGCEPGPKLKIVPVEDIIIHEHFDKSRSPKLARIIEKAGVLQDPPIVARLEGGKYVHLDGANRITVFREEDLLNCPHILVQIVDYFDPESVKLSSWCHLTQLSKDAFFLQLRSKDIEPLPMDPEAVWALVSEGDGVLCGLFFRDGDAFGIKSGSGFESRIRQMNDVVRIYERRIERDHLEPEKEEWQKQISGLFGKHDECNIIVAFPKFAPQQVIEIATKLASSDSRENELKMPPGVTRHIILEGRALRINFPLSVLKAEDVSLEEKNELFKEFLKNNKPRRYEEPTFMYDE
jgi:hypothetical protein